MSDPVIVAAATAVATNAALDLYALVKRRFTKDPKADRALEAAVALPDDDLIARLAEQLARIEAADPEFRDAWRASWRQLGQTVDTDDDTVVNQIVGDVGRAVQARDVHGGITFGPN